LNTGEHASLVEGTVAGIPKLSNLCCVESNLNLKIRYGPGPLGVKTESGVTQDEEGQLKVGGGSGAGSSVLVSFLQDPKTSGINAIKNKFLMIFN
jgi:hypothetical protein